MFHYNKPTVGLCVATTTEVLMLGMVLCKAEHYSDCYIRKAPDISVYGANTARVDYHKLKFSRRGFFSVLSAYIFMRVHKTDGDGDSECKVILKGVKNRAYWKMGKDLAILFCKKDCLSLVL